MTPNIDLTPEQIDDLRRKAEAMSSWFGGTPLWEALELGREGDPRWEIYYKGLSDEARWSLLRHLQAITPLEDNLAEAVLQRVIDPLEAAWRREHSADVWERACHLFAEEMGIGTAPQAVTRREKYARRSRRAARH